MRATESLKEEHKVIKRMLSILGKVCDLLEKGEEVKEEHLKKIMEFIRAFADSCHHGKEEGLLFPAMESAGIPREGGPIGVMLYEHTLGRNFVKGMGEGIENFFKGIEDARKEIIDNARNYIGLLKDHIEKEDNILYPMADMHLSEEEQLELMEKFEDLERKVIGEGVHQSFLELVDNLETLYVRI